MPQRAPTLSVEEQERRIRCHARTYKATNVSKTAFEARPTVDDHSALSGSANEGVSWWKLGSRPGTTPTERYIERAKRAKDANESCDRPCSSAATASSCKSATAADCSICLGTSGSTEPRMTACGHVFCEPCIREHFERLLRERKPLYCPDCRCGVSMVEMRAIVPQLTTTAAELARAAAEPEPEPVSQYRTPAAQRRDERRIERAFERAARRAHMKKCPHCGACIQKTGGCNNMRCRCGRTFKWSEAPCVGRCNCIHRVEYDSDECSVPWFKACKGASPVAHAKAMAANSAVAISVVPVITGAIAAAGTVVVTCVAVPAAIFGPMAMIYEPVAMSRRAAGKKDAKNPFAKAAACGLAVPILCAMAMGRDDD